MTSPTMKCANCEAVIDAKPTSATFVLSEHVCASCQKDVTTFRVVIARQTVSSPWAIEHLQPLRTTFQVPENSDTLSVSR